MALTATSLMKHSRSANETPPQLTLQRTFICPSALNEPPKPLAKAGVEVEQLPGH